MSLVSHAFTLLQTLLPYIELVFASHSLHGEETFFPTGWSIGWDMGGVLVITHTFCKVARYEHAKIADAHYNKDFLNLFCAFCLGGRHLRVLNRFCHGS